MAKTVDMFPKKPDWGTVLLVLVMAALGALVAINYFIQTKVI